MRNLVIIIVLGLSFLSLKPKPEVDWLSFEALETALIKKQKKVIIHFYADWCVYCKKMEDAVYTKPAIAEAINADYYAVKFNVESTDTIQFGGKTFVNLNTGKKTNRVSSNTRIVSG